jgi:hypothetical protein
MTLYTINAGGFSAVADAFALDAADGLWFLSMVGPQTALKAIWASILKQPPEPAWLIQGLEGAYVGDYRRCHIPYESLGTWTTHMTRLPGSGAYHAMVYTKLAEYAFDQQNFLLLSTTEKEAPHLHYRFLDRRSSLPLHPVWSEWLWERGLKTGDVQQLEGEGILAYRCRPDQDELRADLAEAVAAGDLAVPRDGDPQRNGHATHDMERTLKGGAK